MLPPVRVGCNKRSGSTERDKGYLQPELIRPVFWRKMIDIGGLEKIVIFCV